KKAIRPPPDGALALAQTSGGGIHEGFRPLGAQSADLPPKVAVRVAKDGRIETQDRTERRLEPAPLRAAPRTAGQNCTTPIATSPNRSMACFSSSAINGRAYYSLGPLGKRILTMFPESLRFGPSALSLRPGENAAARPPRSPQTAGADRMACSSAPDGTARLRT